MSSIEGLNAVLSMLDGLEDRLMAAAAEGLKDGLDILADQAKALCPVKTGALRSSIASEITQDGDGAQGRVYAAKDYAAKVELGLGRPPHPFLYPAYRMTKGQIISGVQKAVEDRR